MKGNVRLALPSFERKARVATDARALRRRRSGSRSRCATFLSLSNVESSMGLARKRQLVSLSLFCLLSFFLLTAELTDDLAKYLDQMLVVLENNCERKGGWGLRALSLQKCLAYHHLNYAL